MALYFVPLFGFMAVVYAALLVALRMSTKPSERTLAYRILVIITICICVGSGVRGFAVYFVPDTTPQSFNEWRLADYGAEFGVIGVFLISIGFYLKPIFLRALRGSLNRTTAYWSILGWFIIAGLQGVMVMRFSLTLATGVFSSLVQLLVVFWALLELKEMQVNKDITLRLLRLALILFAVLQFYFIVYSLITYLESLSVTTISEAYGKTHFLVRSARITLLFVIDTLLVFYWLQRYSTDARQAAENRKKIELALIEKDLLIKNLINANALIQTGAMTAGLSHEINQFLARIQLDVDSAKVQLTNRGVDNVVAILNRVLAANAGAAALVQNIKRLFVRQDEELSECDLDSLVGAVAQLYLSRAKVSKILLTFELRAHVQVLVRKTLIQQVISNLVINAIDALDSVDRQDKKMTLETGLDGDRWFLRVTDNAHGVRPENAHKIFSLFSTSKSEGSGIGLWLSRYIVEQHGGYIRFTNIEPEGVLFWVDMPIRPRLSAAELLK
jgi:C4-dicarboxylate-specific signal transduction histidine kinase